VTGLREDICVGGPRGRRHYVHVQIHDPPPWLRRGTPVSISRAADSTRTPWGADWLLVQKAILTEVSILSPGKEPAHPAACVEWMTPKEEKPSPAAVSATSDRAIAGEPYDYRLSVYDELERIVGYRMSDVNFERAMIEASRRPIEKVYEEVMAAIAVGATGTRHRCSACGEPC
jgi:hypothetical protein